MTREAERKSRKEIALEFLRLAAGGAVEAAYATCVHPRFIHHNPHFAGDRASLKRGMEESAAAFPEKTFEALRALEDGDLVAVHGRVRLAPGSDWIALIHIFRFEDGLIAEEWEAAQMPPENRLNAYGLF